MVEDVSRSEQQLQGDVVVHGGAQLVRGLMENDFVDELRLMAFPAMLGVGKQLFGHAGGKKRLTFIRSQTVGDGVELRIRHPAAPASSSVSRR
jgi:dihydrofolate reductase